MATRWLAILILIGGCERQPAQPAPRSASAASEADEGRWWCVHSADGYASNCEREVVDCESVRKPPQRRAGPCVAEPVAHCFRYVNKGLAVPGTVVLECSALSTHCLERRGRALETLGSKNVVSECELVR